MLICLLLIRSDFQTNEKKIMSELDELAKTAGQQNKKKADMKGAVEGTEAIREWVSLAFYVSWASLRSAFAKRIFLFQT